MAATSRSLCVMKMIVLPPAREPLEDDVELVDFLRGQERGRLVEDQGPTALVERAHDLDPLLHADREILDERLRIKSESEFVCQLADALLGRIPVQPDLRILLNRESRSRNSEPGDEHEMLVDHAEAGIDRIARAMKMRRLPVHEISPSSGL